MGCLDAFNATEAARVPSLIENTNAFQSRLNEVNKARQDARQYENEMRKLRSDREALESKTHQEDVKELERKIALLEAKLDDFC